MNSDKVSYSTVSLCIDSQAYHILVWPKHSKLQTSTPYNHQLNHQLNHPSLSTTTTIFHMVGPLRFHGFEIKLLTLEIGLDRQILNVQQALLEKLPYFKAALNGPWREAQQGIFVLRDHDPVEVAELLHILQFDDVPPVQSSSQPDPLYAYYRACSDADAFAATEIKQRIMSAIVSYHQYCVRTTPSDRLETMSLTRFLDVEARMPNSALFAFELVKLANTYWLLQRRGASLRKFVSCSISSNVSHQLR